MIDIMGLRVLATAAATCANKLRSSSLHRNDDAPPLKFENNPPFVLCLGEQKVGRATCSSLDVRNKILLLPVTFQVH